ncbi:MAG: DUF3307 domain-containing protein [Nonlabens sp.]|uniref:DUF3307 domain-containing protein n=1 Tax=Nonlabens sp. TaxID=1888209 RepID=UPI00321B4551
MQLLIKLLIAHFLGDFVFQTNKFTKKKEKHKLASYHIYLHAAIHGILSWLLLYSIDYWYIALIIFITHLIIDAGKLYLTNRKNQRWLFTLDQLAHILVITIISMSIASIDFTISNEWLKIIWPLILCIIFLTSPVGIMLKIFLRDGL